MEISVLNHLIHIWGSNFIDPRGSQTLKSIIHKVTDTYLLSLNIDSAPTHRAIAQGYIHLLESWIKQEYGLKISKIHELLVKFLASVFHNKHEKECHKDQISCCISWIFFPITESLDLLQ